MNSPSPGPALSLFERAMLAEQGGQPPDVVVESLPAPGPSPQPSARRGEGATRGQVVLPGKRPLLTRSGWSAFMAALIAVCAVAPALNLLLPESSAFHMSTYAVALLGKIMCYAICALAMDLIWGYTGILSLGHGLFFADRKSVV